MKGRGIGIGQFPIKQHPAFEVGADDLAVHRDLVLQYQ